MAGSAPHIPGCRDLSLIGERVARSLFSAYSDRVGRPVTVTVFPPLSEGRTTLACVDRQGTVQRLTDVLSRLYGRTIGLQVTVDPEVLGGLVVQVGDEVIDGSVAHRLEAARRRLAG